MSFEEQLRRYPTEEWTLGDAWIAGLVPRAACLRGERNGSAKIEPCGTVKRKIEGNPDRRLVSTSYVEKHNQSMRQHMRRFTQLTNAHSKKFANHCAAQAMYFVYYNFVRINSAVKMSQAMAAGIETKLWEMTDLLAMVDAYWSAKKAEVSN